MSATPTLLSLQSSLFSHDGQSSRLAARFVAAWRERHPDGTVIERDLAREPVPHLDAERFQAFLAAPEARTPAQAAVVADSDALIGEWRRADAVAIALPTYNFGIPSTLKAYFDHLARAGVTFRYTENGPVGLLGARPVHLFVARGGVLAAGNDHQTPYVRQFLAFLGMTEVNVIHAEGLALGEAQRDAALAEAGRRIDRLAA